MENGEIKHATQTAYTTAPPTKAGSMSASITTRRPSLSKASGAGGKTSAKNATLTKPNVFSSPPIAADQTARARLWKVELQKLADETGLSITEAHHPPGTSKWNRIERRMFSFISINWRGRPLVSHEVIVQLIASTKTESGLNIACDIDWSQYPKGTKIPKAVLKNLNIHYGDFHPDWNDTISPQPLS